ncbi:MAG: response regulator [Lautropia sp.]|nr:MAG: response regulator [Pseudomonadota bacterium]MBC6959479.1 response regulator [Lautropia sp.]MCL4703036.1 response regulator [Burkholderiaceae bacterium]MCZ2415907.1 response regulator [Burkholderiales bacterium]MDL1908506.1 response regulator [Betaproteobacteria bacterium PRO1]
MRVPIRLLVVDDHTLFRRGLVALLATESDLVVVGEAADAGEATRRARELQPDVILLDNHLPGVTGIAALAGLMEAAPKSKVLMLTVSEDETDLAAALRAGAQGYVLKTIDGDMLAQAIRGTMRGESVVSPEMTGKLVQALRATAPGEPSAGGAPPEDPLARLSPREREILAHIARGASNKAIARALDIAETTVKIHVQHILRKLGLSSRVQAAVYLTGRGSA